MKIGLLTDGEKLFISRRRGSFTQGAMAKIMGVTRLEYSSWELDKSKMRNTTKITLGARLSPLEKCIVLRRRAGLEQKDIAKKIGCSRYWVNCMELGKQPCTALVKYWNSCTNNN